MKTIIGHCAYYAVVFAVLAGIFYGFNSISEFVSNPCPKDLKIAGMLMATCPNKTP